MEESFTHSNLSEKSMLNRIEELEEVLKQIQNEKNYDELTDLPWIGNLGQWYWLVSSNEVVFNEKKVTNLGYKMEDLPKVIGFDYFTDKLHKEDYQRVMDNMKSHLMGLSGSYEAEYRILAANGEYVWYYDRGKITKRNNEGKPLVVSGIVFDITESKKTELKLKEANEKLRKMVITDALTGAFNRRYALDYLNEEIKKSKDSNSDLSLIMFDIDKFKNVNDTYGHDVGDQVLKNIVELISKTNDLCRWGGEEFVIILPDVDREKAFNIAQMIRAELEKKKHDIVGTVTSSFGIASLSECNDMDTLIKKADDLMYKSKKLGRNTVCY